MHAEALVTGDWGRNLSLSRACSAAWILLALVLPWQHVLQPHGAMLHYEIWEYC